MEGKLISPGFGNHTPSPAGRVVKQHQMTVTDLIHRCNDAIGLMSSTNPHKLLIFNCANAMKQLCDRLATVEAERDQLKNAQSIPGNVDGASDGG